MATIVTHIYHVTRQLFTMENNDCHHHYRSYVHDTTLWTVFNTVNLHIIQALIKITKWAHARWGDVYINNTAMTDTLSRKVIMCINRRHVQRATMGYECIKVGVNITPRVWEGMGEAVETGTYIILYNVIYLLINYWSYMRTMLM